MKQTAYEFAKKAHEGQLRKDGKEFFTHPEYVAEILERHGYPEHVVAAGFLHDVIEDTDITKEEMASIFPSEVMKLVLINTEDKTKTWIERKLHTHQQIPFLEVEERAFIAADKFANVDDIKENLNKYTEEEYWSLFNAPYNSQKWYYRGIALSLFVGLSKEEINKNPLFKEYYDLTVEVFGA